MASLILKIDKDSISLNFSSTDCIEDLVEQYPEVVAETIRLYKETIDGETGAQTYEEEDYQRGDFSKQMLINRKSEATVIYKEYGRNITGLIIVELSEPFDKDTEQVFDVYDVLGCEVKKHTSHRYIINLTNFVDGEKSARLLAQDLDALGFYVKAEKQTSTGDVTKVLYES